MAQLRTQRDYILEHTWSVATTAADRRRIVTTKQDDLNFGREW
jgi:hypothetical protein